MNDPILEVIRMHNNKRILDIPLRTLISHNWRDFTRLLDKMPTLKVVDVNGENLLHHCVRLGSVGSISYMLTCEDNRRPDICRSNRWGETPLHVALKMMIDGDDKFCQEMSAIVVFLIAYGSPIMEPDNYGNTAVNLIGRIPRCPASIVNNTGEALRKMFKESQIAEILRDNGWPFSTILNMKCSGNYREIVQTIKMIKPDYVIPINGISQKDVLHIALSADCDVRKLANALKKLLKLGADPNARFEGQTPLHVLAKSNIRTSHYEPIRLLLNAGANPNATDNHGLTPLHYLLRDISEEVFILMIMRYAKLSNEKIIPWMTYCLHIAAANGNVKIVSCYVTHENVNLKSGEGMTPLHLAARERHLAVMYLLVAVGADVNAQDLRGWTPLHYAVYGPENRMQEENQDAVPAIGLLLHFGADVDSVDTFGCTPLAVASKYSDYRAAYQLVRHIALQGEHSRPTPNDKFIEMDDLLYELNKKCLQELMDIFNCGEEDGANYLLMLHMTRQELLQVACGFKEVSYLPQRGGGGIRFDKSGKFTPAAFPIYGNYLVNRVHHANIELLTFQEMALIYNKSFEIQTLTLSADEFVEFFEAEYLL